MLMADLFARYQEKEPVPLMVWALLKHILAPEFLDDLFERTAVKQRQGKLLFSSIVRLMSAVVTRTHKSPREALKQSDETLSEQAFYKKLNGIEPDVCQALVRESAERMSKVIDALGAVSPPPVPGYRTLILDGNAIGATDHRLEPLQDVGSAALPGKSLNILDGQRGIVLEMIPCEDGHAQERSMSDEILERVCVNDLLIADRNFCTTKILCGIVARGAAFLIREHKKLPCFAGSRHLMPEMTLVEPRGVSSNGEACFLAFSRDTADAFASFLRSSLALSKERSTLPCQMFHFTLSKRSANTVDLLRIRPLCKPATRFLITVKRIVT